jgi:hypothetical protein
MASTNPYRNALRTIAVVGAIAGLVLFLIGFAINSQNPAELLDPLAPQPGALMTGLAGFAFWLALIAFFLWLTVSALLWRDAPAAGESSELTHPAHRPAPAGSKLEQIRAALDEND